MWGFILAITELAQTAPSHLKLVLSSRHFFSVAPEVRGHGADSGSAQIGSAPAQGKKDGSGCNFVIFSPEKVNN